MLTGQRGQRIRRRRTTAWGAVLALSAAAVLALATAASAQEDDDNFTLTILHNNDGESKLLPDQEAGFPGVARFATFLKGRQAAAAEAGNGVITLTSGDNFLASQELAISLDREGPWYDAVALSGLYDAMALGNHDFDFGPENAARFISGFDPAVPFLSANLDFSASPAMTALAEEGRVAASAVVETGGERIGVIGAVTQQLPNISSPGVVKVSDVLAAVNREAERLTGDGVNKIILISHLQDVNEELELVGELSDVDVVIAGGGDDLLANEGDTCLAGEEAVHPYPILRTDSTGAQTPVITAPGGYRCLGELNVVFDAAGKMVSAEGSSHGVGPDVDPDGTVQAQVVDPLQAAVSEIDNTVIGRSEVDLDGRRSMVRTTSTNQGNLHADALRAAAVKLAPQFGAKAPDVAIQNGGGIRNDAVIPAGEITLGDTWDIAPFRNFLVTAQVSRETLHVLLEQAVDRIPGAGGQFAQISGMTLVFDPSAPAREINRDGECELTGEAGSRVRQVTLDDGTEIVRDGEVVPGPEVGLATINFLAGGGDCYPLADVEFTQLGISYQAALADYIRDDLSGLVTAAAYPEGGEGRITAQEPPVEYKVRPGDSLRRIARNQWGDESRWPEIFEANKGRAQSYGGSLRNADLIRIGWVLIIP